LLTDSQIGGCFREASMNNQVVSEYGECLKLTGGDKAAAASLALAAALRDSQPAAAEPAPSTGALTAAEAAKRLRVSPWTIYRLARQGKLSSYRAGSALRFTVDEIERFEKESGTVPAKKAAPPFPGVFRHHG
jgi:excisionase family DNA binding protein